MVATYSVTFDGNLEPSSVYLQGHLELLVLPDVLKSCGMPGDLQGVLSLHDPERDHDTMLLSSHPLLFDRIVAQYTDNKLKYLQIGNLALFGKVS